MERKIYKITNSVNDKVYIGITKQPLNLRLNGHFSKKKNTNLPLRNAMIKYGKDKFKIEKIDTAIDLGSALIKETHYINLYNSLTTKNGYNIIENSVSGEFTDAMKISLVEGLKKSKKEKLSDRYNGKTIYIGVYFNNDMERWDYCITFNRKKVSQKNFKTDQDAAFARDVKLLELFDHESAKLMMNFPENFDNYILGIHASPERTLKRNLKVSKYNWVCYEPRFNVWRIHINTKTFESRLGTFTLEDEAAEMADFLNVCNNINLDHLNFPEKLEQYKSTNYTHPKTVIQKAKKIKHANIGFDNGYYRIYIQSGEKIYRPNAKTLEEAIQKRNEILNSIGRKIPD